jgi:hypothetical protein
LVHHHLAAAGEAFAEGHTGQRLAGQGIQGLNFGVADHKAARRAAGNGDLKPHHQRLAAEGGSGCKTAHGGLHPKGAGGCPQGGRLVAGCERLVIEPAGDGVA